ncbi:MAG: hypothetical protein CMP93_02680 [Gammaproteobacteria bacterium]|nr:hypothetical protein [Gammaproteobacteria bacterium]
MFSESVILITPTLQPTRHFSWVHPSYLLNKEKKFVFYSSGSASLSRANIGESNRKKSGITRQTL